jgi:hypothetical protein
MDLLNQVKPTFESIEELREYITNKEESLIFWTMISSVDTTYKRRMLNEEIMEAKKLLAEWKNKEEVSK